MNLITGANKKFVFAAFVLILLTGKVFATPAVAHAQTYGSYSDSNCCGSTSWYTVSDSYSPTSWYDYADSYTPTSWYDYADSYTPSYDTSWYSYADSYTPSTSWYDYADSYTPSYDTSWYSYADSYAPSTSWYDYADSYTPSYDTSWYTYADSYTPSTSWYNYADSYAPITYGTTVTPVYGPSGSSYSAAPVYTGYTTPSIVVGAPSSHAVAAPVAQYVNSGNTIVSNSGNTTITNSGNTNIVDSYNTNVVNSGNSYYAQPQYVPQPTPSCSINAASGSTYAGSPITLSWYSYNATSATITALGSVPLSGSRTVNPYTSTTYTMTVWGPGGSATCSTVAYVAPSTYLAPIHYPAPAHHIPLSSVPYTGFDAGPLGNIIYWSALVAWSLFAGYLVIGYKGGLMGAMQRFAHSATAASASAPAPVILEETVSAPIVQPEVPVQEIVEATPAPVARDASLGTADLLTLEDDGSAPRLVIRRS